VPLNNVINNQPTHAIAVSLDAYPQAENTPRPGEPPGAVGIQSTGIPSELTQGNPGGVDAVGGVGLNISAIT
jgi:hypothetical protein